MIYWRDPTHRRGQVDMAPDVDIADHEIEDCMICRSSKQCREETTLLAIVELLEFCRL